MEFLKIWLGAFAAVVLFLGILAIQRDHAEKLERVTIGHCT